MQVACGMTNWKTTLILLCLGALICPAVVSAASNIYQDAIPHLKACISLIQEHEQQLPATASVDTTVDHPVDPPIDLREVCPTLANFLTYEPISEIDPPLENHTNRRYLESLVSLLEAAKLGNAATLPGKFRVTEQQLAHYATEPVQKPFFLALGQWTFFQLQSFLITHTHITQPGYLHTIYIMIVNLIMIVGLAAIIIYFVMMLRISDLYLRHFKMKWQHQSPQLETYRNLDEISALNLDQQIPALIQLIKQRLQQTGLINNADCISNARLLHIVKQTRPQYVRDMSRLIRLYDRLNYSNKTVAADEINLAIEQTRLFLAEGDGA